MNLATFKEKNVLYKGLGPLRMVNKKQGAYAARFFPLFVI